MTNPAPLAAASEATLLLEPAYVLKALSDPVRHKLVCVLADGQARSVNDLADSVKRHADAISKHLLVLRRARILRMVDQPGGDGRKHLHELPAPFRTRDAAGRVVLDFGTVLLRPE